MEPLPGNDSSERLIVYLQYTNPAGYPPLEHSSRILADRGFQILFLGAAADGAESLSFPLHPQIEVRRLQGFPGKRLQPLYFLAFVLWCGAICRWRRPDWIYVSDPLATPAGLLTRWLTGARVVYHEHDTPEWKRPMPWMQRIIQAARHRMANFAELCIIPQQGRLQQFVDETGREGPAECVWNCPRMEEVGRPRGELVSSRPRTFHYHGSLNAERLPFTVLEALARASDTALLVVIGYETIGSRGYLAELKSRAIRLGLERRVSIVGPLPRLQMLEAAAAADVGLAFMPLSTDDVNMYFMTGASNKPFDYLAVGQMLLVSDLPDWRQMFVEPGYAMACDPYDVESLTKSMRWCVDNPDPVKLMGEAGRQRVMKDWNYEHCFRGVLEQMSVEQEQRGARSEERGA